MKRVFNQILEFIIRFKYFILLFLLFVVITSVFFGVLSVQRKTEKGNTFVLDKSVFSKKRMKIEIFNGCKNTKTVLEITDLLRKTGKVDVVDIEKAPGYIYPRSLILDRNNNYVEMKKLADFLGLSYDRILLQKSMIFVDATVVLGLDNSEIKKKLNEFLTKPE